LKEYFSKVDTILIKFLSAIVAWPLFEIYIVTVKIIIAFSKLFVDKISGNSEKVDSSRRIFNSYLVWYGHLFLKCL